VSWRIRGFGLDSVVPELLSQLTGCEFSGVQTLLVVAIVYVKRGDENSAVRKMHDTSRLWVGWNAHDHCLFCSYAPEVCRSRRAQFSLYASRGSANRKNSQPVTRVRSSAPLPVPPGHSSPVFLFLPSPFPPCFQYLPGVWGR